MQKESESANRFSTFPLDLYCLQWKKKLRKLFAVNVDITGWVKQQWNDTRNIRKINNISNSGQETSDEESAIEELEHGTEDENNNNQMLIFNIFKSPFTEGEIWYL